MSPIVISAATAVGDGDADDALMKIYISRGCKLWRTHMKNGTAFLVVAIKSPPFHHRGK